MSKSSIFMDSDSGVQRRLNMSNKLKNEPLTQSCENDTDSSYDENEEDEGDEEIFDSSDEEIVEQHEQVLHIEHLDTSHTDQGASSGTYDEASENPIDPSMQSFIERMEYAQIFLGQVVVPKQLHHKVKKQGVMNSKEKALVQFVNTILQYPPVIKRCIRFAEKTRKTYSYSIKLYVLFMASLGYTIETFTVCGMRMVECIKQYEQNHKTGQGVVVPITHGVMSNFKFGMQALQFCLGIYHTRAISDGERRARERESSWGKIPSFELIEEYGVYAQKLRYIIAKDNHYDKTRPEMDKSGYSDEQLRVMMIAMYEKTNSGNINVIYNGLNTILELLIGHHLLFRSRNKRLVEISDSVYTIEHTLLGEVPVLGFKFTEGKTLDAKTPPQQMGASRHKDPAVCLVSAFAMSLWYRFDFKDHYGPLAGNRAPNFLNKVDWYPIKVLWSTKSKRRSISYNYEASLVRQCLKVVNLHSAKKTHLGRVVSARKADAKRIEEAQIRRAGKWRVDTIQNNYLSPYPFDFLHGSAGFESNERYFLARDIEPPEELRKMIFPWLEDSLAAIEERGDQPELNYLERDKTAPLFLGMMNDFRTVIIQDLAVMKEVAPNSIFSNHSITREPQFLEFKARVEERIRNSSVFDDIRDQPNVVDVICPGFSQKLETLKAGIDLHNCVVTEQLNSLTQAVQGHQAISAQREERSNRLARAMMNEHIDMALRIKFQVLEAQNKELNNTALKIEGMVQSLFNISSSVNSSANLATDASSVLNNAMNTVQASETSNDPSVMKKNADMNKAKIAAIRSKTTGAIHQIYPGWQLKKDTRSILELLDEWYVPRGRIPSVEERNRLAGAKWRDSPSFYKRRKAIIDYIEGLLKTKPFNGASKIEVAQTIQAYIEHVGIGLNGLGSNLLDINERDGRIPQRKIVVEAVARLWLSYKAKSSKQN